MREILELIHWDPIEHTADRLAANSKCSNFTLNEKVSPTELHKLKEKRRRGEMKSVIQKLHKLLPIEQDSRVTKLNVISESVDYLNRLQILCSQLLIENKKLKRELSGATTLSHDTILGPTPKKRKL